MSFKKYQKVEKTEVVSPEGHEVISDELRKTGKSKMSSMDTIQRRALLTRISDRLKGLDEE